jgi:thiamine biosynthesis lipoprotein
VIVRRARPLLGTLVEVGVVAREGHAHAWIAAAFEAVAEVQAHLSRFDPASDIGRFNALPDGAALDPVSPDTRTVLGLGAALRDASEAAFDVSIGSAPYGWRLDGGRLVKTDAGAQLDLGGIGKGHAVDRAIAALQTAGAPGGWVNAGGDLRVFGLALPIELRDELSGGTRRFGTLEDGAFATSRFGAGARAPLAGEPRATHVSVAAPSCLLADALTKVVAASGDPHHPLLAHAGACAFVHRAGPAAAFAPAIHRRPVRLTRARAA